MQTRLQSFIESKANILIGFPLNYILQFFLIGALAEPIMNKEHWAFLLMSVVFTVASLVRSYSIRRFFNWYNRGRITTKYMYWICPIAACRHSNKHYYNSCFICGNTKRGGHTKVR